jgi:hypothetical protein
MGHNASKVQLGTTQSSFKKVDNVPGTIEAGLVVCQDDDGTYDVTSASGATVGVSLGASLSGHDRMALCREGLLVPIQVGSGTPVIGAQVAVSNTTGKTVDYTGSGDRYVNAVYESVKLTNGGIKEDGTTLCDIALISFPGGL